MATADRHKASLDVYVDDAVREMPVLAKPFNGRGPRDRARASEWTLLRARECQFDPAFFFAAMSSFSMGFTLNPAFSAACTARAASSIRPVSM